VQLSASSITIVGSGAGAGPDGIVVVVGLLAVGSVVSSTVMVCAILIEFPQLSVTEYVRVITSGQVLPSLTSLTCCTIGAAVQLSASSVTTVISGPGTSAEH
jgi:hypothetical protein